MIGSEAQSVLLKSLVEAAHAAIHAKDSYLSAQYQRLFVRRGGKKATIAVGHALLVIIYHLLSEEKDYEELGGNYAGRMGSASGPEAAGASLREAGPTWVKLEPTSPAA